MSIGRTEIDLLRRAGVLPAERYAMALALLRDAAFWARWARHALLALGLGHLLAGIVFFFAYNWAGLPDMAKFAVVEAGILLTALAALWRGADRLDGAAALIAATALTGVLLAVVGQVYQTGADPWQLFALWAALSFPWVLASKNAAHWLVWLVVLHLAILLAVMERLVLPGIASETLALAGVALLPFAVLIVRELAAHAGMRWTDRRWTRLVPTLAGLLGLGQGALQLLFEVERDTVLAAAVFVAILAAIAAVYRRLLPDFAMLAAATGFAMLFLILGGGRLLLEGIDAEFETLPVLAMLAVLILWVVVVIAGAARLLRHLRQSMATPRMAAGNE